MKLLGKSIIVFTVAFSCTGIYHLYTYMNTSKDNTYQCEHYTTVPAAKVRDFASPVNRSLIMVESDNGMLEGVVMDHCKIEIVTMDLHSGYTERESFWTAPDCGALPSVSASMKAR